MKVPQDTIKPLSDINIRKMLKAPDLKTYAGFRDFTIMITILDCGIRLGKLVNLKIEDIDTKIGCIRVKGEIAKTRTERVLPIGKKTCKLISQLIKSAEKSRGYSKVYTVYF